MTPRSRIVISAIVGLMVGGVGGGIAGVEMASRYTALFFVDDYMYMKSLSVREEINVLRSLRSDQKDKAMKLLESRLDSHIVGLQVDTDNANRTNLSVQETIKQAKIYRTEYPWKSPFPTIDAVVSDVLNGHAKTDK